MYSKLMMDSQLPVWLKRHHNLSGRIITKILVMDPEKSHGT